MKKSSITALTIALAFISLNIIGILNPAHAQITIEPGIQVGLNQYFYSIENDDGGYLNIDDGLSTLPRLEIPIVVSHGKWALQTGVVFGYPQLGYYFRQQNENVSFRSPSFGGDVGSSGPVYKIPFKLSRQFRLKGNKLIVLPHAGISWIPNTSTGSLGEGYISASYGRDQPPIFEATSETRSPNKIKLLAEAGLSLDIPLFRYLILNVGATWSLGLQTHDVLEFTYQHVDDQEYTGSIKSRGNSRNFNIGLRVPFSYQ